MEDCGRRRHSGKAAVGRKARRGPEAELDVSSRAPPPRAPRRPRSMGGPGCGPRSGGQQQSPFPTRKPPRRSVESVLAEAKEFTPSLGINLAALHRANNSKYTGLHHSCTQCTPSSKRKYGGHMEGMCGLINILQVDRRRFRRLPQRLAPVISFMVQQPMSPQADHRKHTLSSTRVQEAIKECALMTLTQEKASDPVAVQCAEKEQERRAAKIVSCMSSAVYRPLIRLVAWLIFLVFGKLFGHLYIQQTHVGMMLEAQKQGVPMVFLPDHKSHTDYLIMHFVLFSMGVNLPRIAAGDNLRLPFVSWLVTHLGGFFIKRKLDTSVGKDILYRKCLHEYMERVLHNRENLEFFLEGSRSRSGKPCVPKAGLLSVVVDAVKEGVVEDVLIVPVNISYTRILERRFVKDELMGGVKKPETVMSAVRGAWSILTGHVGDVRVNFAQPFSLQEYLSKAAVVESSLLELSHSSRRRSISSLSQCSHRKLVTGLSYHVMYDITECSTLTPTGMVAFLLLNKYREHGATVEELVLSYSELEVLAKSRGRVVSYPSKVEEAVHYALHHIYNLITVDNAAHEKPLNGVVASSNQRVRPRLGLPDVFDLYHLSNQVVPLVALQAIVARSIMSVAMEVNKSKKNISREKVIRSASFLAQIMAREFFVTPPCEELSLAVQGVVDGFINSEVLKIVGSGYHGRCNRAYLDLEEDGWEDHVPDMDYQLNGEVGGWGHLALLSSAIEPLVEGYWLTATQLLITLPNTPGTHLTEAELVAQIHKTAKAKAQKGLLSRVESCSLDTLRNAVKMMQDMEVLVPVDNKESGPVNHALRMANSNRLVDIIKKLTFLHI